MDSAALQEPLQAFKGPSLSPLSFIDIFRRIFHGIKFTFSEVGVLLSILDQVRTEVFVDLYEAISLYCSYLVSYLSSALDNSALLLSVSVI